MAQGRMLKKEISTSRKLASLSSDSARLLWTWILPHLDIEGRMHADPNIIKGLVVPRLKKFTIKKIEKIINELNFAKLIILYEQNGEKYLELSKFSKHQTLRPDKEAASNIPPPKDCDILLPSNDGTTPAEDKISKDKISKDKGDSSAEADKVSIPFVLWCKYKRAYKDNYKQECTHTATEGKEMKVMSYLYQRFNNWELWVNDSESQQEHTEKIIDLWFNLCQQNNWDASPLNLLRKIDRVQRILTTGKDDVYGTKHTKKPKKVIDTGA